MGCIHADGGSPDNVCNKCKADDERAVEISMMKKGALVVELSDPIHVGEIVAREGKQVKVVWAKGSESWVNRSSLRLAAGLRAYHFEYHGMALGGEVIVVAPKYDAALEKAVATVRAQYGDTRAESVRASTSRQPVDIWPKATVVVHNWDGDY